MKADKKTISRQQHELRDSANYLGCHRWEVLRAIEELQSNDRAEVYEYIRKQKEGLIEARNTLTDYVNTCYGNSYRAGWHTDLETGKLKDRNRGEMLMLIVSEIAEAMEGERKGLMDDHLPHRKMAEVELADAFIRIADYCGRWGYDLEGAVQEKLEYNKNRADHKPENRVKEGGKSW